MRKLEELLQLIDLDETGISFAQVIETIDEVYDFQPAAFRNGDTYNEAGSNNGSCKIFAFAQKHDLVVNKTLHLFGDYYRKDVLNHPKGNDHQNIRNFMVHGWNGISFENDALKAK